MTRVLTPLLVIALTQTPPEPQFDVATVKAEAPVAPGQSYTANLGSIRNGKLTMTNVTLSEAIRFAYGLQSDLQVAGPDWIKSRDVRFAIVGQAPPDMPDDTIRTMLQPLLAERLKLVTHREKKEIPHLVLSVGRNGHKLGPAKEESDSQTVAPGRLRHPRMPVSVMAMLLSRFEQLLILDQTGLSGPFAIDLQWTPDRIRALAPPQGGPIAINGQSFDSNGPTLYTAVQEQLGLRLEASKAAIDVIVVDRAERTPEEN
jgi:uncharacterized protein (TIGR03435 family)